MNATEAAERAGVSPSTITRATQAGRIHAEKLSSGALDISEEALEKYIDSQRDSGNSRSLAAVELAVALERIRSLEKEIKGQREFIEEQRGWLVQSDERLGHVLQLLQPALTAGKARPRWQFWRRGGDGE